MNGFFVWSIVCEEDISLQNETHNEYSPGKSDTNHTDDSRFQADSPNNRYALDNFNDDESNSRRGNSEF